jgi:hypothetical protein
MITGLRKGIRHLFLGLLSGTSWIMYKWGTNATNSKGQSPPVEASSVEKFHCLYGTQKFVTKLITTFHTESRRIQSSHIKNSVA